MFGTDLYAGQLALGRSTKPNRLGLGHGEVRPTGSIFHERQADRFESHLRWVFNPFCRFLTDFFRRRVFERFLLENSPILFRVISFIFGVLIIVKRDFQKDLFVLILVLNSLAERLVAGQLTASAQAVPIFKLVLQDPVMSLLIKTLVRQLLLKGKVRLRVCVIEGGATLPNLGRVVLPNVRHSW